MSKIFGDGKITGDKLDSVLSDLTITIGDKQYLLTQDQHGIDAIQQLKAELERIELHLQAMTDEEIPIGKEGN